jgi:glycyl-tRNA synthetase beta chain
MAQLLLEILSEDIPSRMQGGAARDLDRLARAELTRANLTFTGLQTRCGLRRLSLVVDGLPVEVAARREERKGPRLGAPEAALNGFLRSVNLPREALIERDGVYFALIETPGQPTAELLTGLLSTLFKDFPWPKSMTSGYSTFRWVRPLCRILCLFDGAIVPFSIDSIEAGDWTEGHRFMGSRRAFQVTHFDDYAHGLRQEFVLIDDEERRLTIAAGARALCEAKGLSVHPDEGLLDEVAGMVEWPVPVLGRFDPDFLTLPPEVIRTVMRVHQRYFAVREASGGLAPYFIAVANIAPTDGGALIAEGNARVLAARLQDARFFYEEDLRRTLADRLADLRRITYHARLGTLYDRAGRLGDLAGAIAGLIGADPELAKTAGRLAKADLATAMVGEFPELQGVMGGYYAAAEGLDPQIAAAIAEHYKPQGPGEAPPSAPVSIAVALAEKLDTILGFFSIDEKPTGSRDPFAIRRAALGVIRLILENRLSVALSEMISQSSYRDEVSKRDILAFIKDRLRVALKDRGESYDLVEAVLAKEHDRIASVVDRLAALTPFLASEEGRNLLATHRRSVNILTAASVSQDILAHPPVVRPGAPQEELDLLRSLEDVRAKHEAALAEEAFGEALRALSLLKVPVDAFFEKVLVNVEDEEDRLNRLRLLASVRTLTETMADLSLISA